jgi:hypothetical protein
MITLRNDLIRRAVTAQGYPEPEVGLLHLLGIRGAEMADAISVKSGAGNDPNAYNDVLATFGQQLHLFRASVDPGTTYTNHPTNPEGCAHLQNGCYSYRWGLHKGHPALVQAEPVTVWRDRNKDQTFSPGEVVESGFFGIDIHAAGTGPEVNDWSAGCQVIWGGWTGQPWEAFVAILRASRQARFRYYLVNVTALNVQS